MGPPGSASQSRTLPSLLLPPLPRLSLAVAPLVPGSKPRCPRACVPSAPTLGSGMAAAPFSAEASPVCTVRAPGVGPAAGSVPPGLCPPPAAAASEAPGGWSRRDLCAVTPASRGGRQRHAWWPLPGRWPPETLLCVPARSCPGCPGGWAFLLVRAAGTSGLPFDLAPVRVESRGGCPASHTPTAVPGAVGLKREPCLLHAPRPETPGARLGSREGADCGGGRCIRRSEKKASCAGWVVREGPELKGGSWLQP